MEIFSASHLFTMSAPPIAGGAIAVENGLIVSVGTLAEIRSRHNAPVTEYPGCVLMPGLVNPHTHLELTHFPAWKIRKGLDYAPRTYVDWIIQVIKIKRGLTLPELELSLREGMRISLESGTTAVGDILTDRRLLALYDEGMSCGRIYLELLGHDPAQYQEQLRRTEGTIGDFPCSRMHPGLSPHAPHTVSADFFRMIGESARQRSLPLVIHLAESREESEYFHDAAGRIADELFPFVHWENFRQHPLRMTPVAFLDTLGVLGPGTSVVHCVHANVADVEILRKTGVSVILCPRSNDRLDVGKAPVPLLKKAGIPLTLGTDSLASNDSLSLWDEMRFLRSQFPGLFSPREMIAMVTSSAAHALLIDDCVGTLDPGKRADFLVLKAPTELNSDDILEAIIEESHLEEIFLGGNKV